jgi:prepilin-type N-terminal cleavage/methylation domain-containing protein/prepilin-type processing-associated H-X9-DG protein
MRRKEKKNRLGFTLVELLVVIGVIGMLVAMLMPALHRIRQSTLSVTCKARMKDVGNLLNIDSMNNRGWYYPVGAFAPAGTVLADGTVVPPPGEYRTLGYEPKEKDDNGVVDQGKSHRWPVYVEGLGTWNHPMLTCPSDAESNPMEEHTYILNKHLADREDKIVKNHTSVPNQPSSAVLLMGEKRLDKPDYYMGRRLKTDGGGGGGSGGTGGSGSTPTVDTDNSEFVIVEPYKHGIKLGSNYLFCDFHVDLVPPAQVPSTLDPWDVNLGTNGEESTVSNDPSTTAARPQAQ